MDPVIAGQPGREQPLARYLDDYLAGLANAGACRHTLRAYRGDLLQFAVHHDGQVAGLTGQSAADLAARAETDTQR